MKEKNCDECKYQKWIGLMMKCSKNHKPKFYLPKNELDQDWGYKRKCEDFSRR